jgi:HD-GYP domain-containing protein (c-di-GMP phosphodiesterase class II)
LIHGLSFTNGAALADKQGRLFFFMLLSSWHRPLCFQRVPRDPLFSACTAVQAGRASAEIPVVRTLPATAKTGPDALKLIPFSAEHLRLDAPLPFGVRDAGARLLLSAGQSVASAEQLDHLRAQPLFADEDESNEWRRKLGAAVGAMMRQNAPLKSIAEARPQEGGRESLASADVTVPDQWESLSTMLDVALRDAKPAPELIARLRQVHERASKLGQRQVDTSLYHLIHAAGHSTEKYSSHHALLVMLVCEQAAKVLGWAPQAVHSLGCAALSMNVSMAALQDHLAASDTPITDAMRQQIQAHPEQGAQLLLEAGLDDALWLEAVRRHHDSGGGHTPLGELPPPRQLARLLRRADIFTAKISRRRSRAPMSPVQAAREACLGAGGVPDEVGGALLRATGLYPPGSFVELANGERGIVVARGRRANLPWVASLVAPSGMALGEPALRDTIESRFAVRAAVPSAQIKVRPDHTRILSLR